VNQILLLFSFLVGWFQPAWNAWQATPLLPGDGVVRGVLFYSPTCPHCEYVIQNTLPPLQQIYGGQLRLVGVDVTQRKGQAIFQAALQKYNLFDGGVPMLVMGDVVLIGSTDIPAVLPGLIEQYQALGGVGWPDIPGLAALLPTEQPTPRPTRTPRPSPTVEPTPTITRPDLVARVATLTAQAPTLPPTQAQPTDTPAPPTLTVPAAAPVYTATRIPATSAPAAHTPTPALLLVTPEEHPGAWGQFLRDPLGNGLAVLVLIGMLAVLAGVILSLRKPPAQWRCRVCEWLVPLACLAGVGIAAYLAFIETAQTQAVCGPVGDCNAVQQSEYARLFGVFPIGLLGILCYTGIFIAWYLGQSPRPSLAALANLAMFGLAFGGTLFSIYLTFLEPFVIGATCAWCLASAVLMTTLLWLTAAPARRALEFLV
jgi:uncharacterized membrane protein/thiol-disulfide isomerase/thioredoxin